MKTLENKLIVYDGNCKVCTGLKDLLVRLGTVRADACTNYHTLVPALKKKVDADKFKNTMALVDKGQGPTVYGSGGVAYIFSAKYSLVDKLLGIKPLFRLFHHLYMTISINRYIIATPRNFLVCDCFPDCIREYRRVYIAFTIPISMLLACLFGISQREAGEGAGRAALEMLLIAGTGWYVQMALALIVLKGKALDYIGHLGTIMLVGGLIVVPSMLLSVFHVSAWYIPVASVVCSSLYMLYLHIHRMRFLQISQGWTLLWFMFIQYGAMFWSYYFHTRK